MNQTNKKGFLIIAPYQFGELSDYYYWAKYAVLEGWDVTYIGYRYKNCCIKERSFPGVKIKSVLHYHNRFILGFLFYLRCFIEIILYGHKTIFICQMPFCQILPKLFPKRKIILDLRTLSISDDESVRREQDSQLFHVTKQFPVCSVISAGIGEKIGRSYELIPLGAEELSHKSKSFDWMRLFYIGTYNNRDLSVFIKGLANYQKDYQTKITFDIVGAGNAEEEDIIKQTVITTGVKGVTLHGYLTHDEAMPLFDKCNIGVCFVPVTDYYQNQPPTKLFEYLLSGMAVIATDTYSNVSVMDPTLGVVIKDDVESVYEGLIIMSKNLASYNSSRIVGNSMKYHWRDIVKNHVLTLAE